MRPVLFSLFGVPFPSYFTLLTVGFVLATLLAWRECKRVGINQDDFLDMGLYMFVAGLIGARLLHVVADGYFMDYVHLCTDPLKVEVPSFIHVPCMSDSECVAAEAGELCNLATGRCHPGRDCLAALRFWQGGLAFYGGLILATAVAVWFIRRHKMGFYRVADVASFGIALGLVFGRTGCLLAGCCFGAPTDSPAALEFPGYSMAVKPDGSCPKHYDLIETVAGHKVCAYGRPAFLRHVHQEAIPLGARHSLPVHPTQPYEGAACLLIFAYLYFYRRTRIRFGGQSFWEFCALYGIARFAVEFLRDDDRGLWVFDLSTSQLIAIPLIMAGVWMLWRNRHLKAEAPV